MVRSDEPKVTPNAQSWFDFWAQNRYCRRQRRIFVLMTPELLILCVAAFAAGFIDAVVGGGGLIQTTLMMTRGQMTGILAH